MLFDRLISDEAIPGQRRASLLEATEIAESRWPGYKQVFTEQDEVLIINNGMHNHRLHQYAHLGKGETLLLKAVAFSPGEAATFGIVYINAVN